LINLENEDEKLPDTPKNGAAIPLPAGGESVFVGKAGGNIPDAPLIGPVLPPSSTNTNAMQEKEKILD
jgi:hypothetical protein